MKEFRRPIGAVGELTLIISAAHVDSFNRAANVAQTILSSLCVARGTYAAMRTPTSYLAGVLDLKTMALKGGAVDDLGSNAGGLDVDRASFKEMRQQLNGHIRVALGEVSRALNVKIAYVLFYSGGPLIALKEDAVPGRLIATPYRLARLRFQGATDVHQERLCVQINRASAEAYRIFWDEYDEQMSLEPVDRETTTEDVLDQPAPRTAPPLRPLGGFAPIVIDYSDTEEDAIDFMLDDAIDHSEEDALSQESAAQPEREEEHALGQGQALHSEAPEPAPVATGGDLFEEAPF